MRLPLGTPPFMTVFPTTTQQRGSPMSWGVTLTTGTVHCLEPTGRASVACITVCSLLKVEHGLLVAQCAPLSETRRRLRVDSSDALQLWPTPRLSNSLRLDS